MSRACALQIQGPSCALSTINFQRSQVLDVMNAHTESFSLNASREVMNLAGLVRQTLKMKHTPPSLPDHGQTTGRTATLKRST